MFHLTCLPFPISNCSENSAPVKPQAAGSNPVRVPEESLQSRAEAECFLSFPQPFVVIRLWETKVAKLYVKDEKILKLVLGLQRAAQGLNVINICLLLGGPLKFSTVYFKDQ